MSNSQLHEHREKFNDFVSSIKKNSKAVTKKELDSIFAYLQAQKTNDKAVVVSDNITNRIRSNKFVLVSFPGTEDTVCVLKNKSGSPSVRVIFRFSLLYCLIYCLM